MVMMCDYYGKKETAIAILLNNSRASFRDEKSARASFRFLGSGFQMFFVDRLCSFSMTQKTPDNKTDASSHHHRC